MSIDLKKTYPGDYVIITDPFHDYGKVGAVFRIVDTNIPGEPTAAVAWMIDKETGETIPPHSYRLPCDKISSLPRVELAAILKKSLGKKQKEVDRAQREYEVLHKRIRNLELYYSKERESEELLNEIFNFI